MKPYFAKYLPDSGEIKDGDKYSCPHKGHAIDVGNGIAHPPKMIICTYPKSGMLCNDCYKVKLFLCSKDIKVGDGVIYENTTYKVRSDKPKVGGEGLELVHEVHPGVLIVDQDKCIKVIGEISPEATWVVENQEFDKEDLAVADDTGDDIHVPFTKIDEEDMNELKNATICIRCPTCKQFH